MAQLISIGNSQGIRIPKKLVKQADLQGKQLSLVVEDGLLVTPLRKPREDWKEAIDASIETDGHEAIDDEWLDADLASDEEWEW